jgi:hypothetical protein
VQLALGNSPLRPLSLREVSLLERLGNVAENWDNVLVVDEFVPEHVRHSYLYGNVILGEFSGQAYLPGGPKWPAGVYNSTLADCVIGHDALVKDVKLLVNYVVGPGAVLLDCGQVTCDEFTTFGNGKVLTIGAETGGRPVKVFAELDLEVAAAIARSAGRKSLLKDYLAAVADYLAGVTSDRGIIEHDARVLSTPCVRDAYVGPGARVEGATQLVDSTLLSSKEEPTRVVEGAGVTASLLQWGSSVSTVALVDRSLLTEHSQVERQGKVRDSILGPNTSVGAGEVTSCLLGPFVASHHQSLLIATLWPEGKGNVAYGANIGSNHTSRAPDQEFRAGEGMYFGLGVNVKFPADFSQAPYTVVACGANLLPQKCTFPFSLITTPSSHYPDVSPAYMEITPAWMLRDNLYALWRNQLKYRQRNKARRTEFQFGVFRPDVIDLMCDACRRLGAIPSVKTTYLDADIEGLGKNILQEKNRRQAIETYRHFIRYYALLGLMDRVHLALNTPGKGEWNELLKAPSEDPLWEHQRDILAEELRLGDVADGLRDLPCILEKFARDVEESKSRDDRRGLRLMDDYKQTHTPAHQDEYVQQVWAETRRLQAQARDLLRRCKAAVSERNGHDEAQVPASR